ncbi:hypothetical protein AVEN_90142-1 [Araneus ventricosus]|uniref:Uncharacterized protein n=1 Tax=Araneus ventricosus TaxID=182803 RepID=A0A4Y2SMA8_ARAVE|nr:hypothetical protein AVEN_90142-1 [Araneus ventricosus]
MDAFPTETSQCLVAVPQQNGKWDAFESLMDQGRVQAFIPYLDLATSRIFHHPAQNWSKNSLYRDNFKRCVLESAKVPFFEANRVNFRRVCKKLRSNPTQTKKNSDQRISFKMDNLFVVKQYFTFGFWTVPPGVGHVFQTSAAPMLVFHFNEQRALEAMKDVYTPKPCKMRRSLVERDEYLYDRYVLRPRSTYVVPPGINYLILTVQKTMFAVDVMDFESVRELTDFRTHSSFKLDEYDLPPPSPKGPKMIRPEDRVGQAPAKRQKTIHEQFVPEEPLPTTEIILNATDKIYFFENPIIQENAWNEVLYSEPPQEDINKLLEEFACALEPIPCVQTNVVLPSGVPPPPDNYFFETVANPLELPVVGGELQDDSPLDLRMHCTAGPRKQHVFSVTYPLDLRVRP